MTGYQSGRHQTINMKIKSMKIRRLEITVLGLCVAAVLAGCGAENKEQAEKQSGQQPEQQVVNSQTGQSEKDAEQDETKQGETEAQMPAYVTPEMKGEISVNVYESSEWLDAAVALFEEKYPDMKVDVRVFFGGQDVEIKENGGVEIGSRPAGQTREDYIAWLNTRLISGDAEDIVITSVGLPLGRYETMGVFEDLTPYLAAAEEITEENYYMNMFDAYRTEDGKLYQMPISAMATPLFLFDKTVIENTGIDPASGKTTMTWREALDASKELYQASTLPNTFMSEPRMIVGDQITKQVAASMDYMSGEVHLDKEKLLEKLAVFDELKDYQMRPKDFDPHKQKDYMQYQLAYVPDVQLAKWVENGDVSAVQWKHDDGKVYLCPYFILDFGLNSHSENKALAWEFLRFLVSEEAQALPSCPYAGVNKAGLKARVRGQVLMEEPDAAEEKIAEITELVDGWVSQITAYQPEDTDLIQISEGTFMEYMSGTLSAEQMADVLEERLEQYMNE